MTPSIACIKNVKPYPRDLIALSLLSLFHEATQDCTCLTLKEKGERDGTLLCPTTVQYSQQGLTKRMNQQTETNKQLGKAHEQIKTNRQTNSWTNKLLRKNGWKNTVAGCSYSDELGKWMEVGNSGMFRPEMLRPMGLPEDVSVIAWGLSLERYALTGQISWAEIVSDEVQLYVVLIPWNLLFLGIYHNSSKHTWYQCPKATVCRVAPWNWPCF